MSDFSTIYLSAYLSHKSIRQILVSRYCEHYVVNFYL